VAQIVFVVVVIVVVVVAAAAAASAVKLSYSENRSLYSNSHLVHASWTVQYITD